MIEIAAETTLQGAWRIFIRLACACSEFREQRERLERQWERLRPRLDAQTTAAEFEELCYEMRKCEQLFSKCDNVSSWNVFKKSYYFQKLKKKGKKIEELMNNAIYSRIELIQARLDEFLLPLLPPSQVFGMEVSLTQLKKKLSEHQVVGVYGIGGCGKTTLVSKLCDDPNIKSDYGIPTWVPTWVSIDQLATICQRLLREFNEMNSTSKKKANVSGRGGKMLIVLDGVPSDNSDVQNLATEMKKKAPDSRILITSRDKLDNICDASYSVDDQLSEDDARKIFEHHALSGGHVTSWRPDRQLIDEIVRGCKRNPLALKVIGLQLAMAEEHGRVWQDTADRLKVTGAIFDLVRGLSPSLTSLLPKHRDCFFDLGSFPQDQTIPATAIIDMWTETRVGNENSAYGILLELGRRNLVKLVDRKRGRAGDPDGSFSSLSVSQHVLLRESAIHESTNEGNNLRLIMEKKEANIPKSWTSKNNPTSQAKLVSINTGDMKKSDWPDLDLPNAEVLILNFSASSYYLPRFLQSMKHLKVLVVANHGSNRVELHGLYLLSSLKELKRATFTNIIFPAKPLRTVIGGSWSRLRKFVKRSTSIKLCVSGETAQELQKLSLVHCDVHCMLHILSSFLIVRELEIDDCNDLYELPHVIYDISYLEKLSITNSLNLVELAKGIDKLHNLKTLRLHACAKLKHLPQSLSKLSALKFLDISYCYRLKEIGKNSSLETIDMRSCLSIMEVPSSMVKTGCLKKVIYDEEAVATMWTSCGLDSSKLEKRLEKIDG